jgi:hypothetical protein
VHSEMPASDLLFFTPNSMVKTKKRSFLELFYQIFKHLAWPDPKSSNSRIAASKVVKVYNGRGDVENRIKEGKNTLRWGTIIGLCLAGSAEVADTEKYLAKIW